MVLGSLILYFELQLVKFSVTSHNFPLLITKKVPSSPASSSSSASSASFYDSDTKPIHSCSNSLDLAGNEPYCMPLKIT
jgi:hypothetical protein